MVHKKPIFLSTPGLHGLRYTLHTLAHFSVCGWRFLFFSCMWIVHSDPFHKDMWFYLCIYLFIYFFFSPAHRQFGFARPFGVDLPSWSRMVARCGDHAHFLPGTFKWLGKPPTNDSCPRMLSQVMGLNFPNFKLLSKSPYSYPLQDGHRGSYSHFLDHKRPTWTPRVILHVLSNASDIRQNYCNVQNYSVVCWL